MKRMMLAAVAVLAVSAAAQADDLFAPAYGNTVTQSFADGTKFVIYINADKSWEEHVGAKTMKGIYAWKDGTHACFTTTDPAPSDPTKATSCVEIKGGHKVGDSWSETTPDGKPMTVSIAAGR